MQQQNGGMGAGAFSEIDQPVEPLPMALKIQLVQCWRKLGIVCRRSFSCLFQIGAARHERERCGDQKQISHSVLPSNYPI